MTAKEYLEQLAQTTGLADDVKAGLLKAIENEKLAKAIEESTMLRSDYSRSMDALAADKKKSLDYYQSLVTWKAEQDRLLAEATNGHREVIQPVQGDFLTKKDLDALEKKYNDELARREQIQISLLKDGMRLASAHAVEFKETLDTDALEKLAVDKKLTLRQAYEEMVGSRRTESLMAQRKAEIEAAKAEGAREFASKHKIPVDTQPREYHTIIDRNVNAQGAVVTDYQANTGSLSPQGSRALRESFVDAWNTAGTNTSGGGT